MRSVRPRVWQTELAESSHQDVAQEGARLCVHPLREEVRHEGQSPAPRQRRSREGEEPHVQPLLEAVRPKARATTTHSAGPREAEAVSLRPVRQEAL